MSWNNLLRSQLSHLNRQFAIQHGIPFYESLGTPSTIMFRSFADGARHGNFLDSSYIAILNNNEWKRRLLKPHARKNALPETEGTNACELDSSNSSDALLMNVFCYPGILNSKMTTLFRSTKFYQPEFGVPGLVPLKNGKCDKTEIDLRLGSVIAESKLTELDFTPKDKNIVENYVNFNDVFHTDKLPQNEGQYLCYQLIRNVLAAFHHNYSFFVLCDARRPDLIQAWWTVYGAIRQTDLRLRCGIRLWQEIASCADLELKGFLSDKYAIC